MPVQPRETLRFTENGTFRKADYPWMTHCLVTIHGAGAGTEDGPGEPGWITLDLYDQDPNE